MIDTGLQGRTALVTGTDNPQGIGAATVRALVPLGITVVAVYYRDYPTELVRGMDGNVVAVRADLSDPDAPAPVFDTAEAAVGPISILVNNAAASEQDTFVPMPGDSQDWIGRGIETISAQTHDFHFAVNSRGTALMMAEFARRHMARRATWGRIVNVSTNGSYSFPGEISYGASKFALESYSRAAAVELGPFGITVNIVSPGPIQTGWIPADLEDTMARMSPLGRLGLPEDVANVVVLALCKQADWISGNMFYAGGGAKM